MAQRSFLKIGKPITLRLKVNIYVLFLKQNIKCSISLEPYFREEYNGRQFKTIRRKKQEITALVNVLRVNMAERKCAMLRKLLSLKMVKKQLEITKINLKRISLYFSANTTHTKIVMKKILILFNLPALTSQVVLFLLFHYGPE